MSTTPSSGSFRTSAGLLMMVLCTPLVAQTPSSTPEIYSCTDAQGRKITSDRKILECNDREQRILNPSGTVKARIGPTLTAQERGRVEAQTKVREQERARLEEEKKRDRALLVRYPTAALHQQEREESLRQVLIVKHAALVRVTELMAERTKLEDEMAFYTKDPSKMPQKLRQQIDAVLQALAAQSRFLADKDNEITRTNTRFDEELKRLKPLWQLNAKPDAR